MDVSGSMSTEKKYIARSYFFLLYQFLRHKYERIEVVFISHTVHAKRVTEDEFFKRISVGGTMMSSALETEIEVISKEYHPDSWNIYTFYVNNTNAISTFAKPYLKPMFKHVFFRHACKPSQKSMIF